MNLGNFITFELQDLNLHPNHSESLTPTTPLQDKVKVAKRAADDQEEDDTINNLDFKQINKKLM